MNVSTVAQFHVSKKHSVLTVNFPVSMDATVQMVTQPYFSNLFYPMAKFGLQICAWALVKPMGTRLGRQSGDLGTHLHGGLIMAAASTGRVLGGPFSRTDWALPTLATSSQVEPPLCKRHWFALVLVLELGSFLPGSSGFCSSLCL